MERRQEIEGPRRRVAAEVGACSSRLTLQAKQRPFRASLVKANVCGVAVVER